MTEVTRRCGGPARLATLVSSLALALVLPAAAGADTTTKLSAANNIDAALAWSQLTFSDGSASQALLARDDLFADSLASGGATAKLAAPLLLTGGANLDPRVTAELRRLGTGLVYILGGEVAISDAVEQELNALGFQTQRLQGTTRVETAIDVTRSLFPNTTVAVVARAYGSEADPTQAFADSLATGAYAASSAVPVLYTQSSVLTGTTRAYLEDSAVEFVFVAGGSGAVGDAVVQELEAMGFEGGVTRLFGPNRFATAVAMASDEGFTSGAASDRVLLVEGQRPDAWASGFTAATQAAGGGAPLLLANGDQLPAETAAFLSDANGRIPLVCGPYTTDAACDAASDAMGNTAGG